MNAARNIFATLSVALIVVLRCSAEDYPWPTYEVRDFNTFTEYFDAMVPHIKTGHDPSRPKEAYGHFHDKASVEVVPYLTNNHVRVRSLAYGHVLTFLLDEKDNDRRQVLFSTYLQGLEDTAGIVRQSVGRRMNIFGADVFNKESKKSVLAHIRTTPKDYTYQHIVLALGLIGGEDAIRAAEASDHKCASFALARLGNKEALAEVLATYPKNPTVKDMRGGMYWGLKRLAYVKQPEAIELLMQYLSSDITQPGGRDHSTERLAGWAAEAFVDIIRDIPIKSYAARSPENIEKCREWLKANYDGTNLQSTFPGEIGRWN